MRTKKLFFPTQKEIPSDAVLVSHKLMLRAGLVRKLASGIYTWLPLGTKILRKLENLIRIHMNKAGGQEILMPIIQNAELWQESGRQNAYGPELWRLHDRHGRNFVLGPTHEEVITDLARRELKSYRQLPLNLYQIQTKVRDEIRPRFGVMRSREFIMKDAYSFHLDEKSLHLEYENMYHTYQNIFTQLEIKYRIVEADTGSIGGQYSHEFQVLSESGEDTIVFSDQSDFAANLENTKASSLLSQRIPPTEKLTIVNNYEFVATKMVKVIVVKGVNDFVALIIRSDHTLNIAKAEKLKEILSPLSLASKEQIKDLFGVTDEYLGPVDLDIPCIVDHTVANMSDFCAGANQDGCYHLGINWERDAKYAKVADLRNVVQGDISPDGQGRLLMQRGIEVGHIFQLGIKYSTAMKAIIQDQNGKAKPLYMGCYGLGLTRIIAAIIEQNHDEFGICWPLAIAPFQLAIIGIKFEKSMQVKSICEKLYHQLSVAKIEVLLDDRQESLGIKISDMDLIGIPHQIIISERNLQKNIVEYKNRKTNKTQEISMNETISFLTSTCKNES